MDVAAVARTRSGTVVAVGPARASAAAVSGAGARSTSGGGMRKSRRPYCARSAKTGAATVPPKMSPDGSSITTMIESSGRSAGTKPAKVAM